MKRAIINGRELRGALNAAGVSQREFAELCLTREATISEAINGKPLGASMIMVIVIVLEWLESHPKGSAALERRLAAARTRREPLA